jgi:tetratricopeptide (TPR) repeat protein
MPRLSSTEVPHTALTNHRIPRQGGGPVAPLPVRPLFAPSSLVLLNGDQKNANDPENDRDLGIALTSNARVDLHDPKFNIRARLLLEAATERHSDDIDAWVALGSVYDARARYKDALHAFEIALARNPDHEVALAISAAALSALNRHEEGIKYWQRAIELNPCFSAYHGALAKSLVALNRWTEAVEEAKVAVCLNPEDMEARKSLILSMVQLGKPNEAEVEIERLIQLAPSFAGSIRQWFDRLKPGNGP